MAKINKMVKKFDAVSIVPGSKNCCDAAKKIVGMRFLREQTPIFPLDECDQYDKCECKYDHWDDRRQDERRDFDKNLTRQFYYEDEKRSLRRGRRISD